MNCLFNYKHLSIPTLTIAVSLASGLPAYGEDFLRGTVDDGQNTINQGLYQNTQVDSRQAGNTTAALPQSAPTSGLLASKPSRLTVNPPSRLTINAPRNDVVRAPIGNELDAYAPLGLRAGNMRFFPSLGVGGVVSDNVEQANSKRKSELGVMMRPSLRIESDWSNHSFTADINGAGALYNKKKDYDDLSVDGNAALQIDIRRTTNLTLRGGYSLDQTSETDVESPVGADEPSREHFLNAGAELNHVENRTQLTLRGGAEWGIYENTKLSGGGKQDNDDRDYVEPYAGLRVGYEVSGSLTPFVEAGYAPRIHHKARDRNGLKRSSDGYYMLAGVNITRSPIWDGSVALRYDIRDYDDSSLKTVRAIGFDVALNWRPSDLTSFSLTGATGIDDTTEASTSGIRSYNIGLSVAHQMRENITLTGGLFYDIDEYIGDDVKEKTFSAQAGIRYQMNRNIALTGNYQFENLDTSRSDSDYYENRFDAGVEFRL